MKRKVKYLNTHSSVFMGGTIGQIGSTLPPQGKTFAKLEMMATELGVIIEVEQAASVNKRAGKETALIPYGNIQLVLLDEEEDKVVPIKKA